MIVGSRWFRKIFTCTMMILFIFLMLCLLETHRSSTIEANLSNDLKTTLATTASITTLQVSTEAQGIGCQLYTASDPRPFFEREPPQSNLPRRISNESRQQILKKLQTLRLVIVGCAYNIVKRLPRFRSRTEQILRLFHSSSEILIFESDSTDDTLAALQNWTKAHIYSGGQLEPIIPDRSERIAFCRNTLLQEARKFNPDYLLTVDLDVFAASVPAFLTNFDYDMNDWSAMTANVDEVYYDIWALRTLSDTNLNYDIWKKVWDLNEIYIFPCGNSIIDEVIRIHQKILPTTRPLLEVRSAFCGAALYKMESTKNCLYSGENRTCEHVPFHLCMRENNQARIFINPKFRIEYVEDDE